MDGGVNRRRRTAPSGAHVYHAAPRLLRVGSRQSLAFGTRGALLAFGPLILLRTFGASRFARLPGAIGGAVSVTLGGLAALEFPGGLGPEGLRIRAG